MKTVNSKSEKNSKRTKKRSTKNPVPKHKVPKIGIFYSQPGMGKSYVSIEIEVVTEGDTTEEYSSLEEIMEAIERE